MADVFGAEHIDRETLVSSEPVADQVKQLLIDWKAMGGRVSALAQYAEDRSVRASLGAARAKFEEAQRLVAEALGYAVL